MDVSINIDWCLLEERKFKERTNLLPNDIFVKLTDVVWPKEVEENNNVITDTIFFEDQANVHCLAPEYWGLVYHSEIPYKDRLPTKKLNYLANRISGERLLMFYNLAKRDLVENNHISFNCEESINVYGEYNRNRSADVEQRKQAFVDAHNKHSHSKYGWSEYSDIFDRYQAQVPILLNVDDPVYAALDSEVTIVVETYASESSVAFSEKIFRALKLPRPWLLYCSPGAVDVLRNHGFDVLDDLVDHQAYDHLFFNERISAMLDQLPTITLDVNRCKQAAAHNQQLLVELNDKFEAKYNSILETLKV
jgi:hypothetical protein